MNEHDSDTFSRFARRFAAIEAEIKGPPPLAPRRGRAPGLQRNPRPVAAVVGIVAIVVAVVALGPLVARQVTTGSTSSGSAVGASTGSPSPSGSPLPTDTAAPTDTPTVVGAPTVTWCRLGAEACQAAIGLVRETHPQEVAAAWAIVVADTCPEPAVCDRLYPFDSAVVLVPPPGSSADPQLFRVVGTGNVPQRVTAAWTGPIPAHILAMVAVIAAAPRVSVLEWEAACLDVGSDICREVAAAAITNIQRNRPSGVLLIQNRRACPAVPSYVDGTRCWQADIPILSTQTACMVIAKRTADAQYVQVAGDRFGVPKQQGGPVGCPPGQ